jgi:hypothetical protein
MRNELYWVAGPWPGRLALAARPRGGDWLPDELASWKRSGIDSVLSLLTPEEQRDLELLREAGESQKQGLAFSSFPIPDREVPASEANSTRCYGVRTKDCRKGRICSFIADKV